MDFESVTKIDACYRAAKLIDTIAPDDQMYKSGPDWYDGVGKSGLRLVLHGLSVSWLTTVRRILDLPCGHGRVARHLRAAFPNADMFFCDLDKNGVDFCAETFVGKGVYSTPELTEAALPRDLDVIWIGSLFTHVDENRTSRWLAYLAEHLSEHGILVATFHGLFAKQLQRTHPMINDDSWRTIIAGYEKTGFGYARYTEHDMGDYGVSLSRASKIMDISATIPGVRVLAYHERGWADNHDVLVLTKNDRYRVLA